MKTKVSIVHSPKPCEASVTGCDWGTNTVNPFSMPLWKVLSQFISNGLDLLSLQVCGLGIRTTDCLSHYISPFYVFRLRIRVYSNELGEMWYSDPRKKISHFWDEPWPQYHSKPWSRGLLIVFLTTALFATVACSFTASLSAQRSSVSTASYSLAMIQIYEISLTHLDRFLSSLEHKDILDDSSSPNLS